MPVAACNCDTANPIDAQPIVSATPSSVQYGAVCNDSTNTQTVTLTNTGAGAANFEITVAGADAAFFTVDPATGSLAGTGSTIDVTVTYTPTADAGAQLGDSHLAELVVAWNGEGSPTTVAIDATVSQNLVQPLSSYACADAEMPKCVHAEGGEACCSVDDALPDDYVGIKNLMFGEVDVGATGRIPLRALNKGCGPLTVTSVVITPGVANECDADVVSVEGTFPTTIAGSADHNAPAGSDLELVFRPTSMCTFLGEVTFTTDDPSHPTETVMIIGSGTEPKIAATPSSHAFGEICAPDEGQQTFNIRNTGTKAISIDSIEISPAGTHFVIEKIEVPNCDSTKTAVDSFPHELVASDSQPSCGNDEILIDVRFRPEADCGLEMADIIVNYGDSAGSIEIPLLGGSSPSLVTRPDSGLSFKGPGKIDFDNPQTSCTDAIAAGQVATCTADASCTAPDTCLGESGTAAGLCTSGAACVEVCGTAYKPFEICNEGDANLEVGNIEILDRDGNPNPVDPDDGQPLFQIATNGCVDASLPSGACCEVTLQYNNTNEGFSPYARLVVMSNDPAWAEGFELPIQVMSDVDHLPSAVISQPNALSDKVDSFVLVDGSESTDEDGEATPIQTWTWKLLNAPSVASKWTAMEGVVITKDSIANPSGGGICPPEINNGDCFRCVDVRCRAIEFWPDLPTESSAVYEWQVTVSSGYCEPLLETPAKMNVVASE